MATKAKRRVTITIAPDVLRRVDRVSKALRNNRSQWIENACKAELDQAELFVKISQQPELMRTMMSTFGDPKVMRQMAAAVSDEVTDEQMKLFADVMGTIAKESK